MATQTDRRRQQNTAPPTAAPSTKLPSNPNGGVPEFGGYDTLNKTPNPPPQAPALPPLPPPLPTAPVQPISLQGGKVSYNPTTAPFGFDQSSPGVGEQFWNNNQGMWFDSPSLDWVDSLLPQFAGPQGGETWNKDHLDGIGAPGAGQQFWNGVQGGYNQMTPAEQRAQAGYQGPNNAQTAFDLTKRGMPGSLQPQFDAYYDRMADKAMSNVNTQSAARGVYGSNSALNNSIGAGLDVEAQRAKAATDFSLNDSANQRSWFDSLAGQGRAADLTNQGAFGLNLDAARSNTDRLKAYGDLAFRAEEMDFNKGKTQSDIAFGIDDAARDRLGMGIGAGLGSNAAHRGQLNDAFDAANQTQDQYEGRVNGLYNAVSGFSQDVQGFVMDNLNALLSGDRASFQAAIDAQLAQYADSRGWSDTQTAQMKQDLMDAGDTILSIYGGGK